MNERELLEKELYDLHSALRSDNSDIGDWKVVKSYEYSLVGKEIPYDIAKLNEARQAARDRIKELEEILANWPDEN